MAVRTGKVHVRRRGDEKGRADRQRAAYTMCSIFIKVRE